MRPALALGLEFSVAQKIRGLQNGLKRIAQVMFQHAQIRNVFLHLCFSLQFCFWLEAALARHRIHLFVEISAWMCCARTANRATCLTLSFRLVRIEVAVSSFKAASLAAKHSHLPKWRNWQTRMVQVHVPARVWGFESLLRHQTVRKISVTRGSCCFHGGSRTRDHSLKRRSHLTRSPDSRR